MRWLFLKRIRPFVSLAAVASLVLNLALLVPALYMMQVFDRVFASRSVETLIMLSALVALALALVRLAFLYASNYFGAVAVLEAITRLRRSVYHQTNRLGTLAFRALGPSEAVSISTRHLEVVHDGLFQWLTVYYREPVKFGLLLAFTFLVNFWLSVAFFIVTAWSLVPLASLLFVPYLAWVTAAAALNYSVRRLNPDA